MSATVPRSGDPEPLDAEWVAEVRERAPVFVEEFAGQIGQGCQRLPEPACANGCPRCVRECATRKIIADWWASEVAIVDAACIDALTHDGVVFLHTAGEA